MAAERVKELEEELEALKQVNDGLYRQHANEKAQMQLAIEQEKLRVIELDESNTAYRDENDQWRVSYEQLEATKSDAEERLEIEKHKLEEKVQSLEESVKAFTTELVSDLEELEHEKHTRQSNEEMVTSLQSQLDESNDRFAQLTDEYDQLQSQYQQVVMEKSDVERREMQLEAQHQHQLQQQQQDKIAALEEQVRGMTSDDDAKQENRSAQLRVLEEQVGTQNATIEQLNEKIQSMESEMNLLTVPSMDTGDGAGGRSSANAAVVLRDLQQQVYQKCQELVMQGEKTMVLAEKYEKSKLQWLGLRNEVKDVRIMLLKGIAGSANMDETLYQHVKLTELVRLRLKSFEHEWLMNEKGGDESGGGAEESENGSVSVHLPNVETFSAVDGLGSIGRLERELRLCRSRNKRMQEQIDQLEHELATAMNGFNDFQALKERAVELVSRERVEKELRVKSEALVKEYAEKIAALSEHIEKLMVHLKHEAAAKTKAVDSQRRLEKELSECKEKHTVLVKKSSVKDKQLQELEQGARILEDQLRLMDEKFIDVRNKLDWTRATSQAEVKKLQHELSTLRMKWQLASDSGVLSALPEWGSIAKLTSKSKPAPLGSSQSTSSLIGNNKSPMPSGKSILKGDGGHPDDPLTRGSRKTMRFFEIPKLPQSEQDVGTPWSDEKLSVLQRQLLEKRK